MENNFSKPPVNKAEKKIEEGDGIMETMRKIAKSPLGKTFVTLGAAMAFYSVTEASAGEYKVNPDAIKKRLAQLKADRAKKIMDTRNEAQSARSTIEDCKMVDDGNGSFHCEFKTTDGVRLTASFDKNNSSEIPAGPSVEK